MNIAEWGDDKKDPQNKPGPEGLALSDMAKMTPLEIQDYGNLDHSTLEGLLVGHLIGDPMIDANRPPGPRPADELLDSGIKQEWFENKALGGMFSLFLTHYRETRTLMSSDEFRVRCGMQGLNPDQSLFWKDTADRCRATALYRPIGVGVLIKRMVNRTRCLKAEVLFKRFVKDRDDSAVGPEKAVENFRKSCITDLVDQSTGPIKEFDWMGDFQSTRGWMVDMKRNPQKYQGCKCGMSAIDEKTNGFSKGTLTVFVAKHGGYKSTMMLNVGYGLWKKGYNVLYASLEMEARMIMAKLWCRATRRINFSRIVKGALTEPEDWDELDKITAAIAEEKDPAEKSRLERRRSSLATALSNVQKGMRHEDILLMEDFHKQLSSSPNRFSILNTGQSGKLKCSQLESWLREKQTIFKPDVVIIDYLSLMAPDVPRSDRMDLELGDMCKELRNMGASLGFAAITAAQLKKSAYDRMRKYGGSANKLAFSTDDIADSMQIGANADNVFTMMTEDGGNRLSIFTTKARYGAVDDEGKKLQIDPFTCTISDDIEDTSVIASGKGMADAYKSLESGSPEAVRDPDQQDDWMSQMGGSPDVGDEGGFDPLDEFPTGGAGF